MMNRPKDIYAPLAVQNWVEYADWLETEIERIKPAAQDVVAYCREDVHTLALKAALEAGDD
jgi:hypothetical protein